ncbi:tetratricopeptide repeat protein [Streptomyces sp. NPDC058701]|uniref:tetratricopeptide repeat protein n=1 Tax=Streptomyces sp. NPDC058701 TaxID=3346608 RepID=UPI00364F92D9
MRGPQHYRVAVVLNNLCGIALRLGRDGVAERYFGQALAIKTALVGADHPDLAQAMVNLALAQRGQGGEADAAALYQRAHELLTGTVKPGQTLLRTVKDALQSMLGG